MQLQPAISRTSAQSWEPAPQTLELPPGEVHIWRAKLSSQRAVVEEFWPLLSAEEQTRASRFQFPEDSDRYILAHGILRDILLRYRPLVPTPLCFSLGPKGQPYLRQPSGGLPLRFNLSHSRSLVVLAITLEHKIGIDVEPTFSTADWRAIANRFFSAMECQYLFALPETDRASAFLSLWTQKEAYAKARGEGLSIPLDSFSILASHDGTLRVDDSYDSAARLNWSFLGLTPDEHHLGALALKGHPARVLFWDCSLAHSHTSRCL
jgi:4'-phosphopantetheinyl transferase